LRIDFGGLPRPAARGGVTISFAALKNSGRFIKVFILKIRSLFPAFRIDKAVIYDWQLRVIKEGFGHGAKCGTRRDENGLRSDFRAL
jgi:hypothetical protein